MGGVHIKSCKHDGVHVPKERDYHIECGKRFKELLDTETVLEERRIRASSSCLSMTTCQSKQVYTESEGETRKSRSPSPSSQYTQSLNPQKHSSIRESPMDAIGNLRHTFMPTPDIEKPKTELIKKLELTGSNNDEEVFNTASHKSHKSAPITRSTRQDDQLPGGDSRVAPTASLTKVSNRPPNLMQQSRLAKLSHAPSTNSVKATPKSIEAFAPSKKPHADDVQRSPSPKHLRTNSKLATYTETHHLAEKPPTHPPKARISKVQDFTFRNGHIPRRSSGRITLAGSVAYYTKDHQSPSSLIQKPSPSPRTGSLPRPSTVDKWLSVPPADSPAESPVQLRRPASTSQNSQTKVVIEKPQCLSRIEYTFYIIDTEAYQRPFYDRRVEAIARASQCTICLHKPPPGHNPVYYKGLRVLPVTISARTMVTLKRCIARLDMQYPYFNVKAFCPPDMY
ncbi:hypothetical protein P879_01828 [Paragonimus westermani]|uniref:Uncharacterized protein n=1 Tax=Paragonimus westermani TaxID=34504 RepID=A0A8T0DMD3_9TREM|nr:hypothetical protein P879_01828 [Paragonimus westermani]